MMYCNNTVCFLAYILAATSVHFDGEDQHLTLKELGMGVSEAEDLKLRYIN